MIIDGITVTVVEAVIKAVVVVVIDLIRQIAECLICDLRGVVLRQGAEGDRSMVSEIIINRIGAIQRGEIGVLVINFRVTVTTVVTKGPVAMAETAMATSTNDGYLDTMQKYYG